jgi:uncharacterized protein
MRWDDFRRSDNVEDNRAASASRGGLPGGAGGLGLGTIVIIGLISWYFGIDPSALLNGAQILTGGGATTHPAAPPVVQTAPPHDRAGDFIAAVLGDTEDRWKEIFTANGRTYHPARLRLYTRSEQTPCAFARSAMGPFYCPHDRRIYLDVAFFEDLQNKFGACTDSNACKCASNFRRIVSPASGRTRRGRSTTSSIPAMWTRRCRLRPPSATIACKSSRKATSCPMPSPTAPRSSASTGS